MEENDINHEDLKKILRENQRLLIENNQLLKQMRRRARWSTILNVLWFAFLLGAPVAIYYFILEPNIESLQRSIEVLEAGARNATGLQDFFNFHQTPE